MRKRIWRKRLRFTEFPLFITEDRYKGGRTDFVVAGTLYQNPTQRLPPTPRRGWWWGIYEVLFSLFGFIIFAIGGILFTCVSAVLFLILPRERGRRIGQLCIHYLFRFFLWLMESGGQLRCDLDALEPLNTGSPVVIAPNHLSLLDAIFVIAKVPNVTCIMKAKIWDNPVLGGGARLAGYIRNDAPGSMVRQAAQQLRKGTNLLVFPEGTRMVNPPINSFRGGFALIARKAEVPVRVVYLESNTDFLGKRWPLLKKPPFPACYRMRLGAEYKVSPEEDTKKFVAKLEDVFRDEFKKDASK